MPAYIINEGIVSGGMFMAIGESIIARAAALGGYISFSLTPCLKTPYEQVPVHVPADVENIRKRICFLCSPLGLCRPWYRRVILVGSPPGLRRP